MKGYFIANSYLNKENKLDTSTTDIEEHKKVFYKAMTDLKYINDDKWQEILKDESSEKGYNNIVKLDGFLKYEIIMNNEEWNFEEDKCSTYKNVMLHNYKWYSGNSFWNILSITPLALNQYSVKIEFDCDNTYGVQSVINIDKNLLYVNSKHISYYNQFDEFEKMSLKIDSILRNEQPIGREKIVSQKQGKVFFAKGLEYQGLPTITDSNKINNIIKFIKNKNYGN